MAKKKDKIKTEPVAETEVIEVTEDVEIKEHKEEVMAKSKAVMGYLVSRSPMPRAVSVGKKTYLIPPRGKIKGLIKKSDLGELPKGVIFCEFKETGKEAK